MPASRPSRSQRLSAKLRLQLYGWILFIACALLFILQSFLNQDLLLLVASILFLVACLLFLVPLINSWRRMRRRQ